jgi:hypothetical protein
VRQVKSSLKIGYFLSMSKFSYWNIFPKNRRNKDISSYGYTDKMVKKCQAGTSQTWFGLEKLKEKLAKLSMTTFTYHSSS